MSVGSTSDRLLGFLRPLRKPNGLPPLAMADKVVDSSESDSPVVARLQELLSGPQTAGVVYQSVIVACLRAIYRSEERRVGKEWRILWWREEQRECRRGEGSHLLEGMMVMTQDE